jgi:hypothetical protein
MVDVGGDGGIEVVLLAQCGSVGVIGKVKDVLLVVDYDISTINALKVDVDMTFYENQTKI